MYLSTMNTSLIRISISYDYFIKKNWIIEKGEN